MDRFYNHLDQAAWAEIGGKNGRAGLWPKFQFLFRARPGSDLNFNLSFGPGPGRSFFSLLRAGPGRDCSHAGRKGPGLKNPAHAEL